MSDVETPTQIFIAPLPYARIYIVDLIFASFV